MLGEGEQRGRVRRQANRPLGPAGRAGRVESLAWLLWHIARGEDVIVNVVVAGQAQVFDDAWGRRLGIARPDLGTGMTSGEVTELTTRVDVAALREYRDAVGRRTRELVGAFGPGDWEARVAAETVERAAAAGAFGARVELLSKLFPGRPRSSVLSGIALFHSASHMGEAATIRTAGGFGSGI